MIQNGMYIRDQKSHFIYTLLEGKREINEEEAQARKLSLGLDELKLPCIVVCIAPYYAGVVYESRDKLISECQSYIANLLNKRGFVFCMNVDACDNIRLILHAQSINQIDEQFVRIHQKIQDKFGIELFIGIGSVVESYGRISVSAAEAAEMLAYKYQYADRGVINIANIVCLRYNISYGSNEMYNRVLGCFKDGNLGKLETRLNELIADIRYRPKVSGSSIKRTIIELTVNMLHIASSANVDVDAVLMGDDPYRWILKQDDTPTITQWFMNLASRLLNEMSEEKNQRQKRIIQDACDYIESHIGDNSLGLQLVSEKLGMSAPYFSQLFKNEKKIGLNNYIAYRRVERAKDLLQNTNLKNEDIALQLGFARSNYFSSVFKKITGMTPGTYRKSLRNES